MKREIVAYVTALINNELQMIENKEISHDGLRYHESFCRRLNYLLDYVEDLPEDKTETSRITALEQNIYGKKLQLVDQREKLRMKNVRIAELEKENRELTEYICLAEYEKMATKGDK